MIKFAKEFPTKKDNINDIIRSITHEIFLISSRFAMPTESIRLVLNEAISNAMEHGNHWNPEKKISVIIKKTESCIKVMISDEGDGFQFLQNFFQTPLPLNERGRGIRLIKFLCPAEWQNNGSTINLLIPIKCTL